MRRALHVRGRVTDADTGRPITAFTLVPGYTWEKIQNVWWKNELAKEMSGLSYDVLLSTEAGLGVIRIEAEDYVPAISRGLKDDEEERRGPLRPAPRLRRLGHRPTARRLAAGWGRSAAVHAGAARCN